MIGATGELDCFSAHIRLREPGKSEDKANRSEPSTNRSATAIVSRPRGCPAPRGEEVAALLCLKLPIVEAIVVLPRLESLVTEATAVLACLNSLQNDHRGEIAQGSNCPPLPAHRSVRKEAVDHKHKRKRKQNTSASKSTRARESCHFALVEVPKGEASPHRKPLTLTILPLRKVSFQSVFRATSQNSSILKF
ncbi:hypothetical protein B296_00005822 [Ensete ventricosum]|uniref:Uncharacterized protein n=1 Tax=Ensete ventricosum TaxID=4639 RepID=A0A426YM04_ENSVE|nr:hypothetical protein B296_00005822 [Ensete ventricosum]